MMNKCIVFLYPLFLVFFIFSWTQYGSSKENINNTYSIKTIASIGIEEAQNEKDENFQFASIGSIDFDNSGNIYILDGKLHCIKKFDAKGNFLKKMFRQGEGPNEIKMPIKFRINKFSGTLFILVDGGYRMKEFDLNGNFLRTIQLPQQFFHHFEFIAKDKFIFVSNCKYGENSYDNLKEIHLNGEKAEITHGYCHWKEIERPDMFGSVQWFVVKDKLLWTSPIKDISLISIDLDSAKNINTIKFPGNLKENRVVSYRYNGNNWLGLFSYNYPQPILLNSELFALWTEKEYDMDKDTRQSLIFPKNTKLSLYRIVDHQKAEKVGNLEGCDFMELKATFENRIILSSRDPYPHIKIIEVKKIH